MSPETIARWQFGVTTVYHFLIVPLTIGLVPLVASLETAWLRTGKIKYLRATKFWGKLMLINFALGVATGIVQEFQFGMNWSAYSRFVGDVFGAPLAMEALLAFFLESTFLGLWIFGWGRLKPWLHCATLWIVSIGTLMSGYFILAANSWMQHPVGYEIGADGRPRLNDIWAVLTNKVQLVTFPHTMAGAIMTGGALMFGIAAYQLMRGRDIEIFRGSFKLGAWVTLIGAALTVITGDLQARIMTEVQPMKMAAAEALWNTTAPASFSAFTIGSLDGRSELFSLRIPHLLSFLATGTLNGQVEGINNLQAQYVAEFGVGNYVPFVAVTYWGFRLMIGFGMATAAVALLGLWLLRKDRTPKNKWIWRLLIVALAGPFLANTFGWIFTEMGRQPWTVFGLLKTADSVSGSVGATQMLISFITLTVLYGVLAIVDVGVMARYTRAGPPSVEEVQDSIRKPEPPPGQNISPDSDSDREDEDADKPLVFAY